MKAIAATRRRMLAFLGAGAAAGPLAVKEALDAKTGALSGLGAFGGNPSGGFPADGGAQPSTKQVRAAIRLPQARAEIRSLLFAEECRYVGCLDPDLAALRSFSFAAKVTFQRQRNVERRIRDMEGGWSWERINAAILRAVGIGF